MRGPGKYDALCSEVRIGAQAEGAVIIILNGDQGDGFSVQMPPEKLLTLPDMLEYMAKQIRADLERYKA